MIILKFINLWICGFTAYTGLFLFFDSITPIALEWINLTTLQIVYEAVRLAIIVFGGLYLLHTSSTLAIIVAMNLGLISLFMQIYVEGMQTRHPFFILLYFYAMFRQWKYKELTKK